MNFIDFDFLLPRMVLLEQDAFTEFEDALRDVVSGWLREWELTEKQIEREVPGCLLALAVLVVQRRAEIENGRVLPWLRIQTRNLVVRYWREVDQRSAPATTLTAGRTRRQLARLDGNRAAYPRVACWLGVPAGWLRRRHRRLLARLAPNHADVASFELST